MTLNPLAALGLAAITIAVAGTLIWLVTHNTPHVTTTPDVTVAQLLNDHEPDNIDRDLDAAATADFLAATIAPKVLHAADYTGDGGRPAAVLVVVPTGDRAAGEARILMHPDAYPDIVNYADSLTGISDAMRRDQGQINADTHQLRIK